MNQRYPHEWVNGPAWAFTKIHNSLFSPKPLPLHAYENQNNSVKLNYDFIQLVNSKYISELHVQP